MSSTTPYTCLKKSRHSSRDSPGKIGRTCTTRQAAHTTGKFGPSPLGRAYTLYPTFWLVRGRRLYTQRRHTSFMRAAHGPYHLSTPILLLIFSRTKSKTRARLARRRPRKGGPKRGVCSAPTSSHTFPDHDTEHQSPTTDSPRPNAQGWGWRHTPYRHAAAPSHPYGELLLSRFQYTHATRRPAQWRLRYVTHSAARQDE